MNFLYFLVSISILIYSVYYAYQSWINSKNFVLLNKKQRRKYRRQFWFMPQVIQVDFYDDHPLFEIWMNRIVALVFILASILGIVVSIHGPFGSR
jgi:hypothetical protein